MERKGMKYLGTLGHPIARMILLSANSGNHVVIEVSPKFFQPGILLKCDDRDNLKAKTDPDNLLN
jgi:hypothetical protein